jgi:hypothetical protein
LIPAVILPTPGSSFPRLCGSPFFSRLRALPINRTQRVLRAIIRIKSDLRETTIWAADEVIHAPEVAAEGVRVDAIAEAARCGRPLR